MPSGFPHKLFPVCLFLLGVVYRAGLEVIEVGWIVTCHEKLVTYYVGIFLVILLEFSSFSYFFRVFRTLYYLLNGFRMDGMVFDFQNTCCIGLVL